MRVETVQNYEAMSDRAASVVGRQIRQHPDGVIGWATGGTPEGMYKRLIELHEEEGLDFSKVTGFNLDEYIGLPRDHGQSYNYYMWDKLFGDVNVTPSQIYIPDGLADDVNHYCEWYEDQIDGVGGIDLQILGIGGNGHIGFNEPGSSLGSRTRSIRLADQTIEDNARFFDDPADVPRRAITMGIGTIREADRILLLASGENKAAAIRDTVEGPVTAMVPASALQLHPDVHVIVDEAAASHLEYDHEREG